METLQAFSILQQYLKRYNLKDGRRSPDPEDKETYRGYNIFVLLISSPLGRFYSPSNNPNNTLQTMKNQKFIGQIFKQR